MSRLFQHIIGIDYSGAKHALAGLPGLRVFLTRQDEPAHEVAAPLGSASKYWSRQQLALWLGDFLSTNPGTLVGIDHAFSFPHAYFAAHALPYRWDAFLEDFCDHWPLTDRLTVDDIRKRQAQTGLLRNGDGRWRRMTEHRAKTAKSVFHFDVQGSVAKSTHAGLPWLLYLRQKLRDRLHIWPFDGWQVAAGQSVMAEVYPRLWSGLYPQSGRTPDQHDAFSVAAWLGDANRQGTLPAYFSPGLNKEDRLMADYEGWILGILNSP